MFCSLFWKNIEKSIRKNSVYHSVDKSAQGSGFVIKLKYFNINFPAQIKYAHTGTTDFFPKQSIIFNPL